jgi:hypothetical protein
MNFLFREIGKFLGLVKEDEPIEKVVNSTARPEEAQEFAKTLEAFEEKSEEQLPDFTMTCMLVNSTLTVFILSTGEEIVTNSGTKELYKKVMECKSRDAVANLLIPKLLIKGEPQDTVEEKKAHDRKINTVLESLKNHKEIEVRDELAYLKGINRPMPKLLAAKFAAMMINKQGVTDSTGYTLEYESLKNFWLWCVANPKPEVAELLFDFLDRNGLRLNRQGFFYALRNIVTINKNEHKDNDLIEAISSGYVKIKAWKKNPSNFSIVSTSESVGYELIKNEKIATLDKSTIVVGNLKDLYLGLNENPANRYTDAHTGTFDIRIGTPVKMDPAECSFSTAECNEKGLHFTLNEINYVGCGDTSALVLINPMKVVGIGSEKGRCYEYLPIMTVPRCEVTKILRDKDFNTLELDEWYADQELSNLKSTIKTDFEIEKKKYSYKQYLSENDLKSVVQSIEAIKETIKDRVVKA